MGGLESELSGESFVGTVIGQLGILVIIYFFFAYGLYKESKPKKEYSKCTKDIIEATRIATMMMFLTSFINNTAISFTSCFIFIIILGVNIEPDHSLNATWNEQAKKRMSIIKC